MNLVGNVTISVIHSPDVSNIFKENWFISTEHQPKQAKMTQKSPLHCIILLIPSMVLAVLWSKALVMQTNARYLYVLNSVKT